MFGQGDVMATNTARDQDDMLIGQFANELTSSAGEIEAALGRPEWSGNSPALPNPHAEGFRPPPQPDGIAGDNRDLIMDLPVTMKVVLGSATMPVATLSKLARGSIVRLDKKVGDPVDILVNGRLVARGEVVVLDETSSRFGVTLTQVGGLSGPRK